ncbi:hypothetical protein P3S67_012205 [Capsicum chacoense]
MLSVYNNGGLDREIPMSFNKYVIQVCLQLGKPMSDTQECTFGRHCNVKIAELKQVLESVTSEQKYLRAHHARHCHN